MVRFLGTDHEHSLLVQIRLFSLQSGFPTFATRFGELWCNSPCRSRSPNTIPARHLAKFSRSPSRCSKQVLFSESTMKEIFGFRSVVFQRKDVLRVLEHLRHPGLHACLVLYDPARVWVWQSPPWQLTNCPILVTGTWAQFHARNLPGSPSFLKLAQQEHPYLQGQLLLEDSQCGLPSCIRGTRSRLTLFKKRSPSLFA